MKEAAVQHPGKVISDSRFLHTFSLNINPVNHSEGLIRCILNRTGNVDGGPLIERSHLHHVRSTHGLEAFEITDPLTLANQDELITCLAETGWNFIGLEDPDIVIDEDSNRMHLYFTIAFANEDGTDYRVHLGHAEGDSLTSLKMTKPVLSPSESIPWGAKEVSIAPVNAKGVRYNLIESSDRDETGMYSVIRVATAEHFGGTWEFGEVVFDPKQSKNAWSAGQASPGPLLPNTFVDIGDKHRVGILNARSKGWHDGERIRHGKFTVGLCIYNFETGIIEWTSPEPLIEDTDAKNITFASQFIETHSGEGLLYAHVDDSFVRVYTLNADGIKALLP